MPSAVKSGRHHQRVVLRDQKILQHAHALEQADVLEGARHARLLRHQVIRHALEQEQRALRPVQAARAARGQRIELVPQPPLAVLQRDASFARLVEAGDAVEHRGLAGAVRPDQRGDGAALGLEGQILHGDQAAEAHGQMLQPQHGVARIDHPRFSFNRSAGIVLRSARKTDGSRVEISPRGFQIMISTIASPNSSMR